LYQICLRLLIKACVTFDKIMVSFVDLCLSLIFHMADFWLSPLIFYFGDYLIFPYTFHMADYWMFTLMPIFIVIVMIFYQIVVKIKDFPYVPEWPFIVNCIKLKVVIHYIILLLIFLIWYFSILLYLYKTTLLYFHVKNMIKTLTH
jgi:hypothetical protein